MTDLPPPSSTVPAKASGRGLKILLALSLAVNLAVVGIVAGVALRGQDGERHRPLAVRDMSFGPFTEALTREQRRAMLREFGTRGPGLRDMRAQIRGDFETVLAVLQADPFDPEAFRAAVEGQSRRVADRAEAGRDALVALVAQMTPAERLVFAERLQQTLSRRAGRDNRPAGSD